MYPTKEEAAAILRHLGTNPSYGVVDGDQESLTYGMSVATGYLTRRDLDEISARFGVRVHASVDFRLNRRRAYIVLDVKDRPGYRDLHWEAAMSR